MQLRKMSPADTEQAGTGSAQPRHTQQPRSKKKTETTESMWTCALYMERQGLSLDGPKKTMVRKFADGTKLTVLQYREQVRDRMEFSSENFLQQAGISAANSKAQKDKGRERPEQTSRSPGSWEPWVWHGHLTANRSLGQDVTTHYYSLCFSACSSLPCFMKLVVISSRLERLEKGCPVQLFLGHGSGHSRGGGMVLPCPALGMTLSPVLKAESYEKHLIFFMCAWRIHSNSKLNNEWDVLPLFRILGVCSSLVTERSKPNLSY